MYRYYVGLVAAALVAGFASNANALSVNSTGIGSVGIVGAPCCQAGQVFTTLQLDSGADRSNYMVFDLSSLASQLGTQDVGSATLTISGLFSYSITQAGTYNLYDSSNAATLAGITGYTNLSLATGTTLRDDLRTGNLYGTATLSPGETSIVITLTAAAIADINAAIDSSGSKLFAIGGYSSGLQGYNFNSSYAAIGTLDVQPVPLPAALPLFATGLAGMGLLGWRRRRNSDAAA